MQTERRLLNTFFEAHPEEAAKILDRFSVADSILLLGEAPVPVAAGVLQHMVPDTAAECLPSMETDRASAIVEKIPLHTAALLLRRMKPEARTVLMDLLDSEVLKALGVLLQYPENTAGALMDPQIISLHTDLSVSDALTRIRKSPQHALSYLYVTDRAHTLVGVIDLRELMLQQPKELLISVMHTPVIHLKADADKATFLKHPSWEKFHALPVVDEKGVFLGAIPYKTLRELEGIRRPQGDQDALLLLLKFFELSGVGLAAAVQSLTSILNDWQKKNHSTED